jgi:hypothetical protein
MSSQDYSLLGPDIMLTGSSFQRFGDTTLLQNVSRPNCKWTRHNITKELNLHEHRCNNFEYRNVFTLVSKGL